MCEKDGNPNCNCDEVKREQIIPSQAAVWGRSQERGEETNYTSQPSAEPSTEMPDFSSPSPGEEDTSGELLSPEGMARRGLVHPLSEEDTGISDYQLGTNPPGRLPASPGRSGSSEVFKAALKKTLAGVWGDENGFHVYHGDPNVSIEDQNWTDIEAFLQDRHFREDSATGVPSPSDSPLGVIVYQAEDGRSLTFSRRISPYGFQTIENCQGGSNDVDGNPFPIETVGQLLEFCLLGRESTFPQQGGETLDNSLDIDDQILAANGSGDEVALSRLLQSRATDQSEAESS